MSEDTTVPSGNTPFTVSFKTTTGYDAALIVVRGDDAKSLKKNLKVLTEDLVDLVVDAQSLVVASATAAGLRNFKDDEKAKKKSESSSDGPACEHGKRQRREGTGSRGAWVGFFCPLKKGDPAQCKPIFEDA